MKKVKVKLKNNSYEIHIGNGLLPTIGGYLYGKGYKHKVAIITNEVVNKLFGEDIRKSLLQEGFEVANFIVPEGEQYKSLETAKYLYQELSCFHADRNTPILALGGGVIGDLAGFVAATYLRGLPLVHIPTTLLAQVDSSIGGKVAVDMDNIKNSIGTFYQPVLVLSDTSTLKTLAPDIVIDGLAEVIKYAVISDKGLLRYLENSMHKIKLLDEEVIGKVIFISSKIKASIVQKDEKDFGLRNILNFGHTLGHAIESASDYKIGHGRAVAIGMLGAAKIANRMNLLNKANLVRLENLIRNAGLPVTVPELDEKRIMQAIEHDKKVVSGKIRFVLPGRIGRVFISGDVTPQLIKHILVNWNEEK